MPVEAEAGATEVPLGVLVKVEGMEGATQACFAVPQQRVDSAELWQVAGVLPTGNDGLMAAACCGDGAEAGQTIGEHCAAGSQVLSGPGADRIGTEASHRRDCGVNRVACLVEGNGCNNGNLVVQQPGRVVLHSQVAAELERGDAAFGLPDEIESLKPSGGRQLGGLHDRAGRKRGLMTARAALIPLEPPPTNQAMLMASAARTTESIRPAGLLQGGLPLRLGSVKPLNLRQGEAFLELERAACHGLAGIFVTVCGLSRGLAEGAG